MLKPSPQKGGSVRRDAASFNYGFQITSYELKKIIPAIIVFFAVACGGPQATKTAGGTNAVFDISPEVLLARADTTVDIGKLHAGEIVQYDAWLRNTGTNPLVIIEVETSCGCTSAEYERKPIQPGEKGHFSFRFDSRGMWGMQMKSIEIRTSAGHQAYRLFIQAQVE